MQVIRQVAVATAYLRGEGPRHADADPALLQGLQLQLRELQPDLVVVLASLGLAAAPP